VVNPTPGRADLAWNRAVSRERQHDQGHRCNSRNDQRDKNNDQHRRDSDHGTSSAPNLSTEDSLGRGGVTTSHLGPDGRRDFGAENLDRPHHLVVGHRADAQLDEQPLVPEELVLVEIFSITAAVSPTRYAPRSVHCAS
jgi:hypothetical protein